MIPHRSTPPPTRAELQAILDREAEGWLPRDGETWEALVRRKAPPQPTWWQVADRARHQLALEEALQLDDDWARRRGLFFPVWFGDNDDETPRSDVWCRLLLLIAEGESLLDVEHDGPPFWAEVELAVTSRAFVVPSRNHAPDIPLMHFGPFTVTRGPARAVIDVVTAIALAPAVPMPSRVVPAYSAAAEPAIDVSVLPERIASVVVAAVQRMTLLPEG